MPPKKKGKGKGKKAAEEKPETSQPTDEGLGPSDREVLLQKECDGLTSDLSRLKQEVDELRKENEFLQEEAQQTRIESHEYMSYMAKKTHKRQTTIISLSDQNERELDKINRQKELMLADYEEKKTALKTSLLEKENLLAKANKEFQDLAEYRELREEQLKKIKQLEREVLRMRGKHSDTIQQLKSQFLQEKAEYTDESEEKIQELAKEANKKAVLCLAEHADSIKQENRTLRAELLELIKKSRILNQHKKKLEDQKHELLREKQYSEDIRRLRGVRQTKVMKQLEDAVNREFS
uniref:Coiled-coil domain-containing protein 166-like n=1 Tax=Ciona intestinalis TaxID=7719 RepID=F7AB05_CIOIN|nr:coiled-coil domain-containing protein 166-like [Ciona intestinalis]|eukprot:XP_002132105.1 coiled-coil domain-containing protein 166-like [Ciona intestinalis]